MSELPDPWSVYARLQARLDRRELINDYAWGLEAGLNRVLAGTIPTDEDVERAVRSESRRERYRAQLRRVHLDRETPIENAAFDDAIDARRRLRLIKGQVTAEQWALLRDVGEGHEYKELAAATNAAPGALRARVLRLRRTLGQ